jgi:hypothetical protein
MAEPIFVCYADQGEAYRCSSVKHITALGLATLHFCHCERPAVGRGAKQSPSSPRETRFGLQLDLEIASGAKNAPSQ